MGVLSGLRPEKLFENFEKISGVARGSGNTGAISQLCLDYAKGLGLRCRRDGLNNVVIWKDGSAGMEDLPPVILQGHLDMVCAKEEGCTIDMSKEPVRLMTDGKYIWADQTSLGGDDGIALAICMTLLADDSLVHPPLEILFTSDEETGMFGAIGLDVSDLKGRRLINLDTESEGVFTAGCAGGERMHVTLPVRREALPGAVYCKLTVSGLVGGHSGAEIWKRGASSNHMLGQLIFGLAGVGGPDAGCRVVSMRGGQFDNVICTYSEAVVAIVPEKLDAAREYCASAEAAFRKMYPVDKDLAITLEACDAPAELPLDKTSTRAVGTLLDALPQGVIRMSEDLPNLVQTSLNFGVLDLSGDELKFHYSMRSMVDAERALLSKGIIGLAESFGASVDAGDGYPGWEFRKDSAFRDTAVAVYEEMYGKPPKVVAIHAGLECGLFAGKMPGLDSISLGPNGYDVHTPKERVEIASFGRVYDYLCRLLERLCC